MSAPHAQGGLQTLRTTAKLPVPGPWQASVQAAMADLAARMGKPLFTVAATRVEQVRWLDASGTDVSGLSIWLMTGGRTFKYRGDVTGGTAEPIEGRP